MKEINPFILGRYEHPDYFCDREEEKNTIINALKNQRNITLLSNRKYGKTGLVHHIFYSLETEKDYLLFYVDLMHTTKLDDFVLAFARAILGKLDSKATRIIKSFSKIVKSIRPLLSFDPASGNPQVELSLQTGSNVEITLAEVFEYLKASDRKIIVAFDEFQQIRYYPETNVEALLRSNIQLVTNANFIFSGSEKHLLSEMFGSYSRPFYQSTDFLNLGKIDKEAYSLFIQEKFEKRKIGIDVATIDLILNITRLHTYYVQYLCNRLYGFGYRNVGINEVYDCLTKILQENEVVYYNYRNLLTDQQFNLLRAIALEGRVKRPTSYEFMQKHRMSAPSSVKTALDSLMGKEMIFMEQDQYQLYDVFFSIWLERY